MVMRRPRAHRWRPVPGFRADSTPAPIAFAGELHLFLRDGEGRVGWNRFEPRAGWAEWRLLPADPPLADGPCVVEFGGAVHLFALGQDGRVYRNHLIANEWGAWRPVPGALEFACTPRATVWQGRLVLVVRDRWGEVLWQQYGAAWEGWFTLPIGRVITAPHPIVWGDQLRLFLVGQDHRLRSCSLPPGGLWSCPQRLPGAPRIALPPSAITYRSTLLLAALNEFGQISLSRRHALSGWSDWKALRAERSTLRSVSLCADGERVHLFTVATDGSVHFTTTR